MAKTKFKGNHEKFLKKVNKDFQALGLAVAEGTTAWLDVAFADGKKKSFLDGRSSTLKNKYGPVPGANVPRRVGAKTPVMVYHKTKIVDRGGSFPEVFNKVTYKPHTQRDGRVVMLGTNGIAKVYITKTGDTKFPTGQNVEIFFGGPTGDKLRIHEFGIGVRKRPIVWRTLQRMQKRWGKYIQASALKAIRKRNRVKV